MTERPGNAFLPRQVPIDAYGNGGFRFGDMSHRGSLISLPRGIYGWAATDGAALTEADFTLLLAPPVTPVLLLGTGRRQMFPPPELRAALVRAGIGLEVMDTGAACRTYNVLLAEHRTIAVALIAVE